MNVIIKWKEDGSLHSRQMSLVALPSPGDFILLRVSGDLMVLRIDWRLLGEEADPILFCCRVCNETREEVKEVLSDQDDDADNRG